MAMTRDAEQYFRNGCGRCELGGTPQCKVHAWRHELKRLREIALESGLIEECKWGAPCYTHQSKNVAMVGALKENCTLSFFKGALLKDEHGILEKPGENSQAARVVRFQSVDEIEPIAAILVEYLREAMELEVQGATVDFKAKDELEFPTELQEKLDASPKLHRAFHALTPGRQRGYVLFISGAKQSKTRTARVEKCIPSILEGKGLHD